MPEINDLERGFHNYDGWFFRRDSDEGNVRIWRVRYETPKCTCGHFEHHTQAKNGFQCAAVDGRGRFIEQRVPVLAAGPHIIPGGIPLMCVMAAAVEMIEQTAGGCEDVMTNEVSHG